MRHDEAWAPYCERWLAAWAGRRVDVLLRWYTEDCLYADPRCPLGIMGKAALRIYLAELLEQCPDWIFRFRRCGRTPLGLYVAWWIASSDGRYVERSASAELILRDGRIVQQQSVFDLSMFDMSAQQPDDGKRALMSRVRSIRACHQLIESAIPCPD